MKYKIVDLSIWMDDFIFPGNPPVVREGPINRVTGSNPEYVYDLEFCSQSGSHIQGAHYFKSDGIRIHEYQLEDFEGKAHIIDVTKRGEDITKDDLLEKVADVGLEGKIVVFRTGFMDELISSQRMDMKRPGLSLEAARYLCQEKKIKMIAIDALGVESVKSKNYEVNVYLCTQRILILECITNLHLMKGSEIYIEAFPLKIKGVEGTPCRAIAKVLI